MGRTDVFADLINGPRWQGLASSIKGVTSVMDGITIWIVSISAYFIIACSFIKNVISGVYASYPRLFDKIHDAKMFAIDGVRERLGTLGTIAAFFLSLLPDIKEISEFDDDTVEPKDYFIKAIPKAICSIMIGICIYQGYYRDFLCKIGQFGATMIERFLFSVDPVQVVDNLTNGFGTPKLASDADNSDKSKLVASITKKMYAKTISFYTDITTPAAKTALAGKLESWVAQNINGLAQYTDKSKYSVAFQVDRILGNVDITGLNKNTEESVVQAWVVPYSQFNIDSGEHLNEDWRLRVIVRFTKKHSGAKSTGTITNAQLQIPASAKSTPTGHSDYDFIRMSGADVKGLVAGNTFKVGGIAAKLGGDGITVFGHLPQSSGGVYEVSDLYYSDTKSASNTVKSICLSSSGSVEYKDLDGNVPNWKPGDTAYSTEEKQANQFNSNGEDSGAKSSTDTKKTTDTGQ